MGATRTYEFDTEKDRDAQAVFEKGLEIQEKLATGEADEKTYKGQAGYRQFIKPKVNTKYTTHSITINRIADFCYT